METITIKKKRIGNDLLMKPVTLTDSGVKVSWNSCSNIFAYLYADEQRIMAGNATVEIDQEDDTNLIVRYGVNEPQYLGINRLVITLDYAGKTRTVDAPVVDFVATTEEEGDEEIPVSLALSDDIALHLVVEGLSTAVIDEILEDCIEATRQAEAAAHLEPRVEALESKTEGITKVTYPTGECETKIDGINIHDLKGTADGAKQKADYLEAWKDVFVSEDFAEVQGNLAGVQGQVADLAYDVQQADAHAQTAENLANSAGELASQTAGSLASLTAEVNNTEDWVFTLEDGSEVTKKVRIKA